MRAALGSALVTLALAAIAPDARGPQVEPADLTARPELLGRQVTVEDRVKIFYHRKGLGWYEVRLARTPVRFRIPPQLRPRGEAPDWTVPLRITGVLSKQDGGEYVCDVSRLETLPKDKDRLDKAVAALGPKDAESRWAWGEWAAGKGADFKDEELTKRADALRDESLKIEAERPSPDPPARWLQLAEKARSVGLDIDAGALAHRAFRARMAGAKAVADFDRLAKEIAAAFPRAKEPTAEKAERWLKAYEQRPYGTYLAAGEGDRAVLDRRLLADALEKTYDLLAAENPRAAGTLAEKARLELPDRPEVARRLGQRGLDAAVQDVASLKRDEVESLAKTLDDQGHPERAREIKRRWLGDRRQNYLNAGDVTERINLAELYIAMLGDRATADALFREAYKIEPKSERLRGTLRRLNYRFEGDELVSPEDARTKADQSATESPGRRASDPLIGLTREQVVNQLGQPTRRTRLATQGQVVEQWTYDSARRAGGSRIINFGRSPGLPQTVVQRHYVQP